MRSKKLIAHWQEGPSSSSLLLKQRPYSIWRHTHITQDMQQSLIPLDHHPRAQRGRFASRLLRLEARTMPSSLDTEMEMLMGVLDEIQVCVLVLCLCRMSVCTVARSITSTATLIERPLYESIDRSIGCHHARVHHDHPTESSGREGGEEGQGARRQGRQVHGPQAVRARCVFACVRVTDCLRRTMSGRWVLKRMNGAPIPSLSPPTRQRAWWR